MKNLGNCKHAQVLVAYYVGQTTALCCHLDASLMFDKEFLFACATTYREIGSTI